jgi:purine-nucleoside phosphorylase
MQQLHGFDELRNDQGIIQNRSAKIDTKVLSLHLYASSLVFDFFHSQNNRAMENLKKYCFLAVRMEVKITFWAQLKAFKHDIEFSYT